MTKQEAFRSLFTPINELAEREPEMVEMCHIDGRVDEAYIEERLPCRARDAASLVEIIDQRRYHDSPRIVEEAKGQGIETIYHVTVMIGRRTGKASAPDKMTAKQLASYHLLMDIVDNNEHKKFELPGETVEEAREYIQTLDPRTTKPKKPSTENYKGKCTTLCSAKAYNQPIYESDNGTGPAHDRTFTCTGTFPKHSVCDPETGESRRINEEIRVIATGSTKKLAESNAAQQLYNIIEQLPDHPDAANKKKRKFGDNSEKAEVNEKAGASGNSLDDDKTTSS